MQHKLIQSSQFAEACPLVSCRVFFYTERNSELFSLPRNGSEQNSESLLLFLFHVTEFWDVFSSADGFGTDFRKYASIFVPRNGIPSCFLFRGRVRNGIPEVSVPRNSRNSVGNKHLFRLFRLPRNHFFVGWAGWAVVEIQFIKWSLFRTFENVPFCTIRDDNILSVNCQTSYIPF